MVYVIYIYGNKILPTTNRKLDNNGCLNNNSQL